MTIALPAFVTLIALGALALLTWVFKARWLIPAGAAARRGERCGPPAGLTDMIRRAPAAFVLSAQPAPLPAGRWARTIRWCRMVGAFRKLAGGWKYLSDAERQGVVEHWDPDARDSGDCEDAAMALQRIWAAIGACPALALATTPAGNGHMVCLLDVGGGREVVADPVKDWLGPLADSGLTIISIQEAGPLWARGTA